MRKKTNNTGIPDEVLDSLARALYPDIRKFLESEQGKKEYELWEKERQNAKKQKTMDEDRNEL